MDGAVRETLCSSCSHRNVCAHKDNYLNMVKSLQGMFYKFPKDEIDFMYLKDPDCKLYSKESSTPRPIGYVNDDMKTAMEKQVHNLY